MMPNINVATDPLDASLNSNRSAAARSSRSPSPSPSAGNANNAIVDDFLGRLKDLSSAASSQTGDIADEQAAGQFTEYARASILARPATAMAAQANQTPESVIQLLQ